VAATDDACPVCDGALAPVGPAWVRRCAGCGFYAAALTPRIETDPASETIDEAQRGEALRALRADNFAQVIEHLSRHRDGGRLLDVGSAHGWFLDAAHEAGFEAVGLEPDAAIRAQSVARGHEVRAGFFPDALDPDERFDVITFNDVFEHLPDVVAAARACRAHLADDGLLLLNIPVSTGAFFRTSRALQRLGVGGPHDRMWQKDFVSPHLSYFAPDNLTRFFERHGFARVDDRPLRSIRARGLWARIRYDRSRSLAYSAVAYAGVLAALPALGALPTDIRLQIFAKR